MKDMDPVDWTANYMFPATGRKVVNKGKGDVQVRGWEDHRAPGRFFSFWRWSCAGVGVEGVVVRMDVGVSGVGSRKGPRRQLERFMKK